MAIRIRIIFLSLIGKTISWLSKRLNLGNGSTWPGHIAFKLYPEIFSYFNSQIKKGIVLVAGTNGKTTTSRMLRIVLESGGNKVINNESGANLLNGIISCLILNSDFFGKINCDYAIFEVDEATLPLVIKRIEHKNLSIILLNLFRDQLDRYGEVDNIVRIWKDAIMPLRKNVKLILNADDPQISEIGFGALSKISYFGLNNKKLFLSKKEHATDSIYCPNCGKKLQYEGVYFSHLGIWRCLFCSRMRPTVQLDSWEQPIPGVYNLYNTLACVLTLKSLSFTTSAINLGLIKFKPAFGRQEEFIVEGKKVEIFLAKNPVGLNEAIRTIVGNNNRNLTALLVLNDLVPDGHDVSWIWDVNFEELEKNSSNIICSGLRTYDIALRIKYDDFKNLFVEENLQKAIKLGLSKTSHDDTLFILPTYSAMLEIRKILSGRKIL